jgi:hypothetical protein
LELTVPKWQRELVRATLWWKMVYFRVVSRERNHFFTNCSWNFYLCVAMADIDLLNVRDSRYEECLNKLLEHYKGKVH